MQHQRRHRGRSFLKPNRPLSPLTLLHSSHCRPSTPQPAWQDSALPYRQYLLLSEHTAHTVDCFLSDLRLFARFVGQDAPVGNMTNAIILRWLQHLRWESEIPPAPKTLARRVTFLKNFFGWLAHEDVLAENLAASLPVSRPVPPLPDILFEDEIARLLQAASDDIRCHLLVMLALEAGLKKEEMLVLTLDQIDTSDPLRPTITVRLPGHTHPQRDRLLELPAAFTDVFQRYVRHFMPQDVLLACTDRNLTYILARAVKRAKLTKRVTLQLLRDCYAVRQLRSGTPLPELREKLGLSDEAWYETQEKYRKLAFPA